MEVTTATEIKTRIIDDPGQHGNAKAVLLGRKNKPNNPTGKNQFTFERSLTPYSIKYALADTLLKQGKTIKETCLMTSLSNGTVQRIKKGEIKLSDQWVQAIKGHESNKHTFLSNLILDSINQNDLNKASLLQKVTSSSILIDKRRLLDGESTQNVNHLASLDNLSNMAQDIARTMGKFEVIEAQENPPIEAPKTIDNQ